MAVESLQEGGQVAVVKVSGELDAYLAPQVREQVEKALQNTKWLLIDLSEVTYIDSVGLGIMVGAAKQATEAGGDIAVVASKPAVVRVFEISGTKDLLNVVETVDQARQVLQRSQQRSEQGGGGQQ